jgi:hypothetical protein
VNLHKLSRKKSPQKNSGKLSLAGFRTGEAENHSNLSSACALQNRKPKTLHQQKVSTQTSGLTIKLTHSRWRQWWSGKKNINESETIERTKAPAVAVQRPCSAFNHGLSSPNCERSSSAHEVDPPLCQCSINKNSSARASEMVGQSSSAICSPKLKPSTNRS